MAMKQSNPDGLDNFITFSNINKEKFNNEKTVNFWNGIKVKMTTKINYLLGLS